MLQFKVNDRVRVIDFNGYNGREGVITEIDHEDDVCPYLVTLDGGADLWCCGDPEGSGGTCDLERVIIKAPIRNTLDELKRIMDGSIQRENLLFQWVKEDRISFKQFLALLEYKDQLAQAAREIDSQWD